MQNDSFVVLLGTIPERPEFSKTNDGHLVGEFHVLCRQEWQGRAGQQCDRELRFLVRVTGHEANSLRKYWHPGCSVTVAGVLDQRTSGSQMKTFIKATSLSYLRLSPILEAMAL